MENITRSFIRGAADYAPAFGGRLPPGRPPPFGSAKNTNMGPWLCHKGIFLYDKNGRTLQEVL